MLQLGPDKALAEVQHATDGMPGAVVGSCVTAAHHGLTGWGDVDWFVYGKPMLFTTVQSMLDMGWTLDERFDRVWYRWLRYGLKGWHTNSIKLHTLNDVPVNVVLKYVDGHPTTSLAQVLESFDFGLLAMGWDMESGQFRDLRPYLFPGYDLEGPLPMMPNKRNNWVRGFISQYNGLREGYRYAKYAGYGYDMSLVGKDLVTGYRAAALYHADQFDADKKLLGQIYGVIADHIEDGKHEDLRTNYESLNFNDPLDEIMEALL